MNYDELLQCADDAGKHPKFMSIFVTAMKREITSYATAIENKVEPAEEYDHLNFHFAHRHLRPAFWELAQLVALAQPSSGAAERAFSRYRNLWGTGQEHTLFSLKRLAVMLAINNRVDPRAKWKGWGRA